MMVWHCQGASGPEPHVSVSFQEFATSNSMNVTGFIACLAVSFAVISSVHAEMSAEELAKLAQNPVGNLISVPFQNNTNLNFGSEKGTQNMRLCLEFPANLEVVRCAETYRQRKRNG